MAGFGEGTEEGGRIPARWLAGEGEVAREVEQFKANLWVVVTRLEVAGRVVVGVGQSTTARVLVDGGAPVVKGKKGMAGELHWSKAELLLGLGGAGWRCSSGLAAGGSLPELEKGARRCTPAIMPGQGYL